MIDQGNAWQQTNENLLRDSMAYRIIDLRLSFYSSTCPRIDWLGVHVQSGVLANPPMSCYGRQRKMTRSSSYVSPRAARNYARYSQSGVIGKEDYGIKVIPNVSLLAEFSFLVKLTIKTFSDIKRFCSLILAFRCT